MLAGLLGIAEFLHRGDGVFRSPPRMLAENLPPPPPISPATLDLMRRNFIARANQHMALGDQHGAEVYRRLAEAIR